MISDEKFREILSHGEDALVDYKAESYKYDNDHLKSEFIKDVLAMANTPRQVPAYIVTGVKYHADQGTKDLLGIVGTHPDDSDLQARMNLAKVEPRPTFSYDVVNFQGQSFGVIEIPVDASGPFIAAKDFGVIKRQALYFRKGTTNTEASSSESMGIYDWFLRSKGAARPDMSSEDPGAPYAYWDTFFKACHSFDPSRMYAFILGDEMGGGSNWSVFGRLPLTLVLDFDRQTEQSGAYHHSVALLRQACSVHLLTFDDKYTLAPDSACYWYAARGLDGRANSLVETEWRAWNRKYGSHLEELIANLARASAGRPITVINLWYAPEYARTICGLFDRFFGDYVDFVFALPDSARLDDLANQFSAKAVPIDVTDILLGISSNYRGFDQQALASAGLPKSDNGFYLIEPQDLRWLYEDLDVVHSNIELEHEGGGEGSFLRGAVISWRELNAHYDADRDIAPRLRRQIEREFKSRSTSRLNLYHWPGAGGTTLARRIAWDLRRTYPVVILKRAVPGETVSRLRKIFSETAQPILALVEGADAISDKLEQLFNEAKSEQIPVVFLSILRRFDLPQDSQRNIFLGQVLSLSESARFVDIYKRAVPSKEPVLTAILNHGSEKERTPFNLALATFERDYRGITKYVEDRLQAASPVQREIMTYLAIAYYYGHKAVLPQFFAAHLGQPVNHTLQLERVLEEPQLELLIKDDFLRWRPAHQLIADEILSIVLSDGPNERHNWKQGLSVWALNFVRALSKGLLTPSEELLDLLRRVFILRDEHDLLGTESAALNHFSAIVHDIPNLEGKLNVLKELVTFYPEEPHFWGHLGRFYNIGMKEPLLAIPALETAISLAPNDPVLYHMQGMCYRSLAYEEMERMTSEGWREEPFAELKQHVQLALDAFRTARELDQFAEHAYISPVQLLLRVIDFGFKISRYTSRSEFLVSISSGWYREKLDEIETLMERVRGVRQGERPSRYVISCQADLDRLYDDYSRALAGWQELLTRRDVFAPPIRRQIVRAYLARSHRRWTTLPPKEIERIVDMMEENMRDEPSSDVNIRIWFNAFRLSARQNSDIALDRLATWRTKGDSQEAYYYLYILHVLKAIDGSMIEIERARDLIEQSKTKARTNRNRTRSFEWFGLGTGIQRLIHYTELGDWDDNTNFYGQIQNLQRVEGRVVQINGPEAGYIELVSCGLRAFFVPAVADVFRGRDQNQRVDFYLGFSYDGLRAWSVRKL